MTRAVLLLLCAFVPSWPASAAQSVTLAWDANPPEDQVQGYYLYHGPASGQYTNRVQVPALPSPTCTISNLASGSLTFFVVTAFTAAGLESDPSNEVSYTVPGPPPPRGLRVITTLQSATSIDGPWSDLAALTNELPLLDNTAFYRARLDTEKP